MFGTKFVLLQSGKLSDWMVEPRLFSHFCLNPLAIVDILLHYIFWDIVS